MKVVKKGKMGEPWVNRKVTCESCTAKIKLEAGDSVRLVSDQRDGNYYELKCPECGESITIDATLFQKSSVS